MKRPTRRDGKPVERRIAVVWLNSTLRRQRVFASICRRAALLQNLTLLPFTPVEDDFQRQILAPVRRWRPHGIIAHIPLHEDLFRLRMDQPGTPLVTANLVADGGADAIVMSDYDEAFRIMTRHFRDQGLRHIAYFSANEPTFVRQLVEAFKRNVPDSPIFARDLRMGDENFAYTHRHVNAIGSWLKALPRPCGVMTFEDYSGRHLVRICRMVGLHVPRDIQVIGSDDVDLCLSCDPHVTSIVAPDERIGELCVETLLQLMNRRQPPPPRHIPVGGFTIIPRGSTGPVSSARATMAHAIHLMNANAAKGIRAGRIVELARTGHTSFYRAFRETTGRTPAAYLRALRLADACRMLAETDAPVMQVAGICGFSSANYFSRFFARETGLSPRAWRESRAQTGRATSRSTRTRQ